MENKEYESPKITVISLEPDASLMDTPDAPSLPGMGGIGVRDFNNPSVVPSTEPNVIP